jgi:serine/threonine protein kinase, bacterial
MAGMSQIARRGARLKKALVLVSLGCLVVVGWAGVHAAGGRSGPRMINVGSSEDAAGSVAVSPGGKTLFAASGDCCGTDSVTVVNLATGQARKRIAVGRPPVKLTVTPDGKTLFALIATGDSTGMVTSVNLKTGRTRDLVRVLHGPLDMAASPDSEFLYVLADTAGKSMAVLPLSVASWHVGRGIPVPAGSQVLAVSPDGRTLYVGAGNPHDRRADEVIAIDARSGKTRALIPVPRNVQGLAVSPDGSRVYVLGSDAYSDEGGCPQGPCDLVTIDAAKGTAVRTLALNSECFKLAAAPDGNFVYVLNADQTITPVETGPGLVGPPIRTGSAAQGDEDFALAPDGRTFYVAERARGVAVIPVPLSG